MKSLLFQLILTSCVLLKSNNNVNAGVTCVFIRKEYPSKDIPLDNEVFAVPTGYNSPQQVHITQEDYDVKAVIISWVTADEPEASKVQYGTSKGKYEFTAEGRMTNDTFMNTNLAISIMFLLMILREQIGCLNILFAVLSKYYYKIGNVTLTKAVLMLDKFLVSIECQSDLGQTYNSLSTLEHYMQSGAQTVLFVGDLSYADRYQYNDVGIRWDSWGRFVEKSTAYQPLIWSAGNHEIEYMPYMDEVVPFKSYLQRYPTPHLACKSSSPMCNDVHFMEGESMRAVFEEWYNVSSGDRYPLPDKSTPVYITVGDGGNQEGLAGRFRDPQPEYSAFREASYGHSTLEIRNRTHAFYHWNRNDDGEKVPTDSLVLHNQDWSSSLRRRKLKKHHLSSRRGRIASH
ncbi:Bifunctional purple acid phosphatase 26 [Hibiscus syriacus]|uniref:Purple acid phosphatase n=1 Tax=Hibiscus syriacus TaxID=106335 RepID=A0A6A2XNA0_HIBSY|nr:Bifunctional purple acid phosphatase 26 [Hibiscus syriacus]